MPDGYGELTIQLHDGDVRLGTGQLFVVPRGVEHCPIADGEVQAVLVEPTGVVNTGDAGGTVTAAYDDSLAWLAAVFKTPAVRSAIETAVFWQAAAGTTQGLLPRC